jgi:hypothetical protein
MPPPRATWRGPDADAAQARRRVPARVARLVPADGERVKPHSAPCEVDEARRPATARTYDDWIESFLSSASLANCGEEIRRWKQVRAVRGGALS